MKRDGDRYYYPYVGWISSLIITKSYLGDNSRTALYNKDYGYDIIILAGQSNMVGAATIQEDIDNDYSDIACKVFQYDFNTDNIIAATNQLKHYTDSFMSGGSSTYENNTGGWLEFA